MAVSCLAWGLSSAAWAQSETGPAYKFNTGYYSLGGGAQPHTAGLDLNVRRSLGSGNLWLGWFRSPGLQVHETRAGMDQVFTWGPVRVQPSLQTASGGFWGGSLGIETGDSWFAGVGIGRTNLRNYVNLNFDPNDAWMASGGYRWSSAQSLSLQVVHDNRQNPDQQHLHVVYRAAVGEGDRLTLDLLNKRGTVDGEFINRMGLSVGYDWPRVFARVAYDPKVNFTVQNMWRMQLGSRF